MSADWEGRFESLLGRIKSSGIARPLELKGCSEEEIIWLEQKFGVVLPRAYRKYLETMGQGAGRLFTHDHAAVTYPYLADLTTKANETLASKLPQTAFVIHGRLGETFLFILCDNSEDSAVYRVIEWGQRINKVYLSVMDWLHEY